MTANITPPLSPIFDDADKSRVIDQNSARIRCDIDTIIITPLNDEPWELCRLPTKQIELYNPNWDKIKSAPGIYISRKSDDGKFYEIAVHRSYIPWLLSCKFELDRYDPTKPLDTDVQMQGTWEAARRAKAHFLQSATKAIRSGRKLGLELCYRNISHQGNLQMPLEWALVNHDILESDPLFLKKFIHCLVFLGLNLLEDYNSPSALNLLGKDQDDLLQAVREGYTDKAGSQMISLVRCLLEFCSGRQDIRQKISDQEYTVHENTSLYGSLVGITGSNSFGNFDPQKMLIALSKSKVFTKDDICILDTVGLSIQMMKFLPIGFPDGYLHLPGQVLCGLSTGEVDHIRSQIKQTYCHRPSLQMPENNVMVLLTWSSMVNYQHNQALRDWVASDAGLCLYERLISNVQDSQTTEQLSLTLAALLCFKRLLPCGLNDTAQPTRGSYLTDFESLINGETLSNERAVFERMGFSFLRVLDSFRDGNEYTTDYLDGVLNTSPPLLEPLDGFSDQYWARRMNGLTHTDAFEMVKLLCSQDMTAGLVTRGEESWEMVHSVQL